MKKRLFSPIVITIILAILAVSALVVLKPQEEKVIQKAASTSQKLQKILLKNQKAQTEEANPNLLTAERIYTEDEIKNTTEIQFEEMIKDIELRLPTNAEIKQIPAGALHHTPELVMEAGRNIGALKEVIKFHPEYENKVIPLYTKCAQSIDRPTAVRALCLTNLIELSKRNKTPLDLKSFPSKIVELTKIVTDM